MGSFQPFGGATKFFASIIFAAGLAITGGNFLFSSSGTATFNNGIVLPPQTPSSTTNALYNEGGVLTFNGVPVGGGGGGSGTGWTDDGVKIYNTTPTRPVFSWTSLSSPLINATNTGLSLNASGTALLNNFTFALATGTAVTSTGVSFTTASGTNFNAISGYVANSTSTRLAASSLNIGSNLSGLTGAFDFVISSVTGGIILNRIGGSESFIRYSVDNSGGGQVRGLASPGGLRFTNLDATTEWGRFDSDGDLSIGNMTFALATGTAVTTTGLSFTTASGTTMNALSSFIATSTIRTNVGSMDVWGDTFTLGAASGAVTRPDSTAKTGRLLIPHFTNSQNKIAAFIGNSVSGANNVYFGGGSSLYTAATDIAFYTAANATTLEGTERMHITSAGRVGIATSTPNVTLEVLGHASSTGWAGTFTTSTYATSTFLNVGTTARLPSDTLLNGLNICLADGTNCPPTATGGTLASVTAAANGTYTTNTLQFYSGFLSASSTVTSTLTVLGNTSLQNATTVSLGISNLTTGGFAYASTSGAVMTSSTGLMFSSPSGYVGIGTSTPQSKLDVSGKLRISETSARAFTLSTRDALTTYPVPSFRPSSANATIAVDIMPNGTPSESATNGYAWLDVCDADILTGTAAVACGRVGARSDAIEFGSRAYDGASLKPLYFTMDEDSKLTVTTAGNLDAQNPGNAVAYLRQTNSNAGASAYSEVGAMADTAQGTLRSFSSAYSYDSNNYQNYSAVDNSSAGLVLSASGASGALKFLTGGALISANTRMVVTPTGSVGIGTTSPSTRLDVLGQASTTGLFAISTTSTYATSTWLNVGTTARLPADTLLNGLSVCLANGTNCPAGLSTPTLAQVTAQGSSATSTLTLYGGFIAASSTVTSTFTVGGQSILNDVTSTNVTSTSLFVQGTFRGAGLNTDCSASGQKLQWSATTNSFSCGADYGGNVTTNTNASTTLTSPNTYYPIVTATSTPSSLTDEVSILTNWSATNTSVNQKQFFAAVYRGNGVTAPCGQGSTQVSPTSTMYFNPSPANSVGLSLTGVLNLVDSPATTTAVGYTLCIMSSSINGVVATSTMIISNVNIGADLAEVYYSKRGIIKPGTLVSFANNDPGMIEETRKEYDYRLLGVVSTKPSQIMSDKSGKGTPTLIALSGRVPVRVIGKVETGDYLTSSNVEGVAMKAIYSGSVIGQALSSFDGKGEGEVVMLVNHFYYQVGTDIEQVKDDPLPLWTIVLISIFTSMASFWVIRNFYENHRIHP